MARNNYWESHGIVFRPKRTLQVVRALVDGYTGIPPEVKNLPQKIEYGSRNHANLLFLYAFTSSHGVKTNDVIHRISQAIDQSESGLALIDPLDDKVNIRWIADLGLISRRIKKRADWLVANKLKLVDMYDGDPRLIFANTPPTKDALLEKIMEFDGFGLKIASLLIVFFQGTFWHHHPTSPIDEELHAKLLQVRAIPTDIHLMRMFGQCDLISSCRRDHHHALSNASSEVIAEIAKRHPFSTRLLAQASFERGSQICRNKPKDPVEQASYCKANCSIEPFCSYLIPADEYGITGRLRYDKAIKRIR